MLLIDDMIGMWDARMTIEEIPGLEIRTAVPPSGFLVQGDEKALEQVALALGGGISPRPRKFANTPLDRTHTRHYRSGDTGMEHSR